MRDPLLAPESSSLTSYNNSPSSSLPRSIRPAAAAATATTSRTISTSASGVWDTNVFRSSGARQLHYYADQNDYQSAFFYRQAEQPPLSAAYQGSVNGNSSGHHQSQNHISSSSPRSGNTTSMAYSTSNSREIHRPFNHDLSLQEYNRLSAAAAVATTTATVPENLSPRQLGTVPSMPSPSAASRSSETSSSHMHQHQNNQQQRYQQQPQLNWVQEPSVPRTTFESWARPNPSSSAADYQRQQQQHQQQHQQQYQQQYQHHRSPAQTDQFSTSSTPSSSSSSSSSQHQQTIALHRVYVLNCASCDTFLSDRGMRAVLLLKPNVILFSTDAAPSNAGPAWPDLSPVDEVPAERTCDCLTSSLGCHGCGSLVGYNIVQPCNRCTASVAKHQKSANHHRYVFHHNEVVAKERRYFTGERGVIGNILHHSHPTHHHYSSSSSAPYPITSVRSAATTNPSTTVNGNGSHPTSRSVSPNPISPSTTEVASNRTVAGGGSSHVTRLHGHSDFEAKDNPSEFAPQPQQHQQRMRREISNDSRSRGTSPTVRTSRPTTPSASPISNGHGHTASGAGGSSHRGRGGAGGLKSGDIVYWHNLVQGGERSEPIDPRDRPQPVTDKIGR